MAKSYTNVPKGRPFGPDNPAPVSGKSPVETKTIRSQKAVSDILEVNNLNPVQAICDTMNRLDDMYERLSPNILKMDEHLRYFSLRFNVLQNLQSFVYAKKALEYKTEKTNVNVDYNDMLNKITAKTIGTIDTSKLDTAMTKFEDKVNAQVGISDSPLKYHQDDQDDARVVSEQ